MNSTSTPDIMFAPLTAVVPCAFVGLNDTALHELLAAELLADTTFKAVPVESELAVIVLASVVVPVNVWLKVPVPLAKLKFLPPKMVVLWFRAIPAVAFVVPTFKVVVPLGVSSRGVCAFTPKMPVSEMFRLPVCAVPGVAACKATYAPVVPPQVLAVVVQIVPPASGKFMARAAVGVVTVIVVLLALVASLNTSALVAERPCITTLVPEAVAALRPMLMLRAFVVPRFKSPAIPDPPFAPGSTITLPELPEPSPAPEPIVTVPELPLPAVAVPDFTAIFADVPLATSTV